MLWVCPVMVLWVWLVVGVTSVSSDDAVGVVSCGCVQYV